MKSLGDYSINVELLESLRIENGYSQREVAEKIGFISHTQYNFRIKGKSSFTIGDIIALSKLYNIDFFEIVKVAK